MNSVHRWWQLRLKIQKNTATRRKAKTGSTSVQLQPLMIYSKPLLSMKGAPFSGRGYHHQDSFACQLCNTVSMCFLDHAYGGTLLSLPTIMTWGQPASKNSWVKKGFRTCFNKAGDRPEEWSPSELHLVSLGRNFTGFPAWQNPGGRMCRKAQGPQSLQVRSPASLSRGEKNS